MEFSEQQRILEREVGQECLDQMSMIEVETYPRFVAVPSKWWQQWVAWTGVQTQMSRVELQDRKASIGRPGPLHNAPLQAKSQHMNDLTQGEDYEWIPEELWKALQSWYEVDTDPVVMALNTRAVRGNMQRSTKNRRSSSIYEAYDIPTPPPHWIMQWRNEATIRGLSGCLTCRTEPADYKCGRCLRVSYCRRNCQASHWKFHKEYCDPNLEVVPVPRYGLVGLSNLGNTCYMNSTVQCLSHCWPLTRYFISGDYKQDCNLDSKLGTGGAFANAWEQMLRKMWLGNNTIVTPSGVKSAIATLPGSGNQFAGYQQHDAQELLVFLLDTLHEDVNLVKVKPYFEMDSDDSASDATVAQLAAETFSKHLKRENSMISALFQGQLHNTVVCPSCKYRSNTFSPFMFLQLALPIDIDRVFLINVIQLTGKGSDACFTNNRYAVTVAPTSRCRRLKARIQQLSGVASSQQWLVRVDDGLIVKEFCDNDAVSSIPYNELTVYELWAPERLQEIEENVDTSTGVGNIREVILLQRLPSGTASGTASGTPLVIRYRKNITFWDLRYMIANLV
eukprot:CAMPEP_0184544188 /NCGR_PEP_ID=MMETSP0199_2-20130426/3453_1 /TAXON_ID=1112570 /ORGANISM="Thraustochytrium sp., Strain LLF1b" /LENGTH=562 /DNA_ID=CAMNT_0026938331 /DNA_START=36 /DNA_END=1721 /DNA_ORIENTATION=+